MVVLYTDVFLYKGIEGRRDTEVAKKGGQGLAWMATVSVWLDRLSIFGYRRGQVHPDGSREVVVIHGVEIQWHRRENARDVDTVVHGTL